MTGHLPTGKLQRAAGLGYPINRDICKGWKTALKRKAKKSLRRMLDRIQN